MADVSHQKPSFPVPQEAEPEPAEPEPAEPEPVSGTSKQTEVVYAKRLISFCLWLRPTANSHG